MHASWDLMNAKYRAAVREETGAMGLRYFGTYLPRVFVVYEAAVIQDDVEVESFMRSDAFDPGRTVVLQRDIGLTLDASADAPPASAAITSYKSNSISVDVATPRDAILVLSEIYYPGWQATIDGNPAPLERANWNLRAVPVPAGNHTVQVTFAPRTFRVGAVISGLSLALLLAIFAWRGRGRLMRLRSQRMSDPRR
jgi:hypothetical protein